jgi:hypothetical protein
MIVRSRPVAGKALTAVGDPRFDPEHWYLVFLVRSRHGGQYVPPAATGRFADVPLGLPAAPYIEQLARDGITSGCAPTLFCP